MKIISILFISLFLFLSFFSVKFVRAESDDQGFQEVTLEGKITNILEEKSKYQKLEVLITKGLLKSQAFTIENGNIPSANYQKYHVGDSLIISYSKDINGQNLFVITDFVRRSSLLWLFVLFALLTVLVGRTWGATSLLGMAFSFFIIFKYILPQIVSGADAVTTAVLGSAAIIPVTFSLSHGLKTKTLIAGIGTIITLILTGFLASSFVNLAHLSGFASEEAGYLQFDLGGILNMKGILLAGMLIASLGILDDITISQASIVAELKKANSKYRFRDLFDRSMSVGRDHIASLVNTLVLVYAGASLPLLLLFINNPHPFTEIINYEIIAEEVVRTLVGSIGLILAVPITSAIASYYFQKTK